MSYKIVFTKQAKKDYERIVASPYKQKALRLLKVLKETPMQPPYEKLVDQERAYSRRINIQHRLVYEVFEEEQTIKILAMWTHYENV